MSCNLIFDIDYDDIEFPSYYLESDGNGGIFVRYLTDDEVNLMQVIDEIQQMFYDIKRKHCNIF